MTQHQKQRGRFITLEGGEGAGKSTQGKKLVAFLESQGYEVLQTREPGGSEGGELIRAILVQGPPEKWDPMTEYLLFSAARRDHIERMIKPALAAGKWVVCDRFLDSSRAYQGIGRGVGLEVVDDIYQKLAGDFKPDLTLVFDLPVEEGLGRTKGRTEGAEENRFENMGTDLHERIRQAFLGLAKACPDRYAVINASQTPDGVAQRVQVTVKERLLTHNSG